MIFSPGSAGTFMEVFEETALNHYLPIDKVCPMIFFGKRFWTETAPVFPFLNTMLANEQYNALKLSVTDDLFEVIETIEKARVS